RYPALAAIPKDWGHICAPGSPWSGCQCVPASRSAALAGLPLDCPPPSHWACSPCAPGSHWLWPEGNVFSRNLGYANGQWLRDAPDDSDNNPTALSLFAEYANNIAHQDPRFVDERALTLALQPDSPAYTIPGFQPIPFASIGVMADLPGEPAI